MDKLNIIVTVAVLGLVIFIGWIWWGIDTEGQQQKHDDYCDKWKTHLDNESDTLNNNIFRGDAEVAQFNTESSQYNKECYYNSP
jgi:nitrogen fixation-related uncharacterized protein